MTDPRDTLRRRSGFGTHHFITHIAMVAARRADEHPEGESFFNEPSHERDEHPGVAATRWSTKSPKELKRMMGWYHDDVGWGGSILMTVAMVAFWALVVFALLALFRGDQASGEATPDHRDPMEILEERFARGEINEDEYHARRSVLRASAPWNARSPARL